MTRVGVRTAPWERAQLQSSMNQQATEYGPRVFANVGLTQGWQLNERWGFDFGVDQSKTVSGAADRTVQRERAARLGIARAATSSPTFVGAMYRSELWTFTSRLESRHSDDEDRLVASGGFYREPRRGTCFLARDAVVRQRFRERLRRHGGRCPARLGIPAVASEWIVLDRLDLKHESRSDPFGEFESARAINNLNANWQLDHAHAVRRAARRTLRPQHVRRRALQRLSALYGVDLRRELTTRFDVGLHGTMLESMSRGVSDHAVGLDLGVTVARNVWISIGYNFSGFRDDDFEASRYTAQGPFIKFRMKADQDTFRDLPWFRKQ